MKSLKLSSLKHDNNFRIPKQTYAVKDYPKAKSIKVGIKHIRTAKKLWAVWRRYKCCILHSASDDITLGIWVGISKNKWLPILATYQNSVLMLLLGVIKQRNCLLQGRQPFRIYLHPYIIPYLSQYMIASNSEVSSVGKVFKQTLNMWNWPYLV